MATTIDDKISLFTKVIFEKLENEYSEKKQKLVEYYEAEKKAIAAEFKKKMAEKVSEATQEANLKRDHMVSKARTEAHFEVLRKREELLQKLFNEVNEKIKEFLDTPKYWEFLKDALIHVTSRFPQGEKVFYIFTPNDLDKHREDIRIFLLNLKPQGDFEIVSGDSIVGGVLARSESGRLEVDLSINTLLKENRKVLAQLFFSRIGREV
ncbi:MAG: V-type ATP synthase subunit E [Thermosediminibacteraceae bacterium]|nr:V-type ATP synthase subunit E [Thermosediminibacteraceae bacterium]